MLSIVTPVLNGAQFIEKLLKSVRHLDVPCEHIIIDGGSTDGTLDTLSKYPEVKVINQINPAGMYAAIHEGFQMANGEFISWINSDDWILKEGYELLYNSMATGNWDLAYGDGVYFFADPEKYVDFPGKPFGKFLFSNGVFPCLQPSTIYRKSIYMKIGGLNFERFKISGDIDFFTRYAQASNEPFTRIQKACVVFLKYGSSLGDRNHALYLEESKHVSPPKYGSAGKFLAKLIYRMSA